jgi:cell fate (sporulation/competence/biofilm development) regulator YlbF (YheA/YmcA/DUF963 family)
MMNTDGLLERARELGRSLGQTEEYKALARAKERFSGDRESVKRANRLAELELEIARGFERGEEPAEQVRTEYEQMFSQLQSSTEYQALVAAQSNFDKILARVNNEISKGIESGAQSRIILPS